VDLNWYKGQLKQRLDHIRHMTAPDPAVMASGTYHGD